VLYGGRESILDLAALTEVHADPFSQSHIVSPPMGIRAPWFRSHGFLARAVRVLAAGAASFL